MPAAMRGHPAARVARKPGGVGETAARKAEETAAHKTEETAAHKGEETAARRPAAAVVQPLATATPDWIAAAVPAMRLQTAAQSMGRRRWWIRGGQRRWTKRSSG